MKKLSKIVSIVLSCIMLLSLFTVNVLAEETVYDISENQDNSLTATYNSETGVLTIAGAGRMVEYISKDYYPYASIQRKVTKIICEEDCSIEYISKEAFSGFDKLTEIILPKSIKGIGQYAFHNCVNVVNFECIAKDIELTNDIFGHNLNGYYEMGYKAENKTATVDASNAYLVECLDAMGYEVETVGTPPTEKWSTYPSECIIEVGAETPNNVTAYINRYTHIMDFVGEGAIKNYGSANSPFAQQVWISKINFHEGITHIGDYVLDRKIDCLSTIASYVTINLPNSLVSVGTRALYSVGAKSLILPENVTTVESMSFDYNTLSTLTVLTKEPLTLGTTTPIRFSSSATVYMYSTNTTLLEYVENKGVSSVIFLDDAPTSGVLDNGIKWTYDINTHTITFEGEGDIPTYDNVSDAPWYTTGIAYGSASTYVFGTGITSVGSSFSGMGGTRIDYGYGGSSGGGITSTSGTTVYAPASLSGSVYSAYPDAIVRDIEDYTSPEDADKEQETAIIVSAEPTIFIVTVPIRIDVSMDKDGVITTGTDYKVENECPMGPIIISEINVVSRSDWEITNFNADYKNMKASSNKIGMTINEAEVETDGTVALNDSLSSVIKNKESKDLSFEVKMPAQKTAIIENVLAVVFTLDFDKV